MRSHSSSRRGFTLIEVILIVALLGLLGVAAIGSYLDSQGTFTFLANYKSLNSSIRTVRNYALTNKAVPNPLNGGAVETPDRYGIFIGKQNIAGTEHTQIIAFADNGLTDNEFDDASAGASKDFVIGTKNFDFLSENFDIVPYFQDETKIPGNLVIFYEKSTGELTAFYEDSGTYVIIPKEDHQFVVLYSNRDNLERYTVIYLIAGLPEEFIESPFDLL